MKLLHYSALAFAAAIVAGCAVPPQCGPGSTDPSCGGGRTAQPAGEGPAERDARIKAFEGKLSAETQMAEQSLASAVEASKTLPAPQRARNPVVKTMTAPIQDSKSARIYEFKVLESASIDMPLAGKGKAGYVAAMDEIKGLANQMADSRGSATIVVDQASADVRGKRVNTKVGMTQTANGNPVSVEKVSSGSVLRGMERYTVRPAEVAGKP